MEPIVQITKYSVGCIPEGLGVPDAHVWNVHVEYAGEGLWAVRWMGDAFDVKGKRSYESSPSGRAAGWLARHRFDRVGALELAKRVAPTIKVNGRTPADVIELHEAAKRRGGR